MAALSVVEILALVNAGSALVAYLVDQARAAGATPEQIAEERDKAVARFDAAAAAVAEAEPPPA